MGRVAVTKEDALPYIENLQRMVPDEFQTDLAINMDESGFCQRLTKEPRLHPHREDQAKIS
jgi:hypothetical protein